MLKKFVRLKNIGKFVDCKAAGDVEFRPLTLIFGENGRGKTTLCGVLRSVSSGDQSYLSERKTLGASDDTDISILTIKTLSWFSTTRSRVRTASDELERSS